MSVLPGQEPVRSWRPRSRGELATLGVARRVAGDLAGGLSRSRVRAAVRGIRRLLGVEGVGLADLSGQLVSVGRLAAEVPVLVDNVLHTETKSGRLPTVAVPLHSRDELVGVLVVTGADRMGPVREV